MRLIDRPSAINLPDIDDSLLAQLYAARGVHSLEQMDRRLSALLSPVQLPGIEDAAERLADAIEQQQSIMIIGDFDADGATSVALCMLAFTALGAKRIDFLVPNRFDFGYGLSPEIVAIAALQKPDVIVTVDNGVASIEGVASANELGIDVIVTDHHLPGDSLPAALAIVNPNLKGSSFVSKAMAGVGVAYYVLSWVRQKLRARAWFERMQLPEPNLAQYLDLVALGTVADVVPLDQNNRILVHQGLLRMRKGLSRPGIEALARQGKRDLATITAQDLGFAIGPRLNAAGRLEDMSVGIRCLTTSDPGEAEALARQLDDLNKARREIETDMLADAELLLAQVSKQQQSRADGVSICVYHESFHQGVVGIVAGRLREQFHLPCIVFADAGDAGNSELKGSARSIDGLNIRDALDSVATRYPSMLSRFGGHAMAAGLTIKRAHLQRFQVAFDKAVSAQVNPELLRPELLTDGELNSAALHLETAQLLLAAGPWGSGFAEPLFRGEFELINQRVVGGSHLKLVVKTAGRLIDAIAFRQPQLPGQPRRVQIAYKVAVNDYAGQRTLQLMVEYLEPIP